MNFIETFLAGMTPSKPKQNEHRKFEREQTAKHGNACSTQKSSSNSSQTTEGRRFTRSTIKSQSLTTTTTPSSDNANLSDLRSQIPDPTDASMGDTGSEENQTSPVIISPEQSPYTENHDTSYKSDGSNILEQGLWEEEPEVQMSGH